MTTPPPAEFDPASPFLDGSDLAVSFSTPELADEPLTYVNGAFCRLVGYGRDECVGRNCRFLQGEATDPAAVAAVRAGIEAREYRLTPLLNYRSDGEAFTNGLLIGPMRGGDGTVPLFGMQWDIDRTLARRRSRAEEYDWGQSDPSPHLEHFERLIARVVDASLEHEDVDRPTAIVERLVAISRPQQYPPHERFPNWTRADSLLSYLSEPYGDDVAERLRIGGDAEVLALHVAHPLALAVHELAFATRRQARTSGSAPRIELDCGLVSAAGEPALELVWRARQDSSVDPRGEAAAVTRAGLSIVEGVAGLIGGRFDTELDERGIEAVLRLPNRMYAELGER